MGPVAVPLGMCGATRERNVLSDERDLSSIPRLRFLRTGAMAVAASQLGATNEIEAQTLDTSPAAENAARVTHTSFESIKQIGAGVLNNGYAEVGPTDGKVAILLHGWPYDIHSFVDVAPLLAARGYRVIVPYVRGCGTTTFLSSETVRSGEPGAVAVDVIDLMDALNIEKAVIGGYDWGGRTADIVAAIWPERCRALVSVSGYLLSSPASNELPLPPAAEYQWWYQFYFATARGELGYDKYRHDFGKLIWKIASPKWAFDDATFDRTAAAFENPDYVKIVVNNYRYRLGLVPAEKQYEELEARCNARPPIAVPTITMEGDANGAPHAPPNAYRGTFTGTYEHRLITGGVGHNLPQEAPQAFAQAIIDVDAF
jgi:pimeloyl-ACP methyl ester carboxylesterase